MPAWLGSLRFRLTAFYTVLLAAVIVTLAFSLSFILERQLENDLDDRLYDTVEQFKSQVRRTAPLQIDIPPLDPYSAGNVFIQFTDYLERTVISNNLEGSTLPSATVSKGKPVLRTETVGNVDLRVLTVAYYTEDDLFGGVLTVATTFDTVERTVDRLQRLLLWGAIVGIGGAMVGGWLLASGALRPIDRITATAATIAMGNERAVNLSARLDEPHANDEVSRLARTFNAMLDRLETAFVAQRRFLADASHELRTPLTAIRGNADVLRRQAESWTILPDREDTIAALDDLRRESARMSRLVADLLLLARADAPETLAPLLPVRLDTIAAEAVRTVEAVATGQSLVMSGDATTVIGDQDRLRQLVIILVDNAVRHTPETGSIRVIVSRDDLRRPTLTVHDDGEGIAPEHLPHIFERFYRVDSARARATGGTGLGLAIARSIASDHDATIEVASVRGQGTTFRVTF